MESLCKKLIKLLDKPEEYLRPSDKRELWTKQTRNVYNFVKDEEEQHSLPASAESLHHLDTDGLDTEQIWQVLELQNKTLLSAPEDLSGLDDVNLCFNVAKLSSLVKYNKLLDEKATSEHEDESEGSLSSEASDMEGKTIEEAPSDSDEEEDEDEGVGSSENLEEDDLSDGELLEKSTDVDGGLNLVFDDDSDNEEDNFDELVVPEGMEDSDVEDDIRNKKDTKADKKKSEEEVESDGDDDDEEKEKDDNRKVEQSRIPKRFKKTKVDSEFFRLRECEWVADNDIIGDNYDADSDDIDLMKDVSDGEEDMGEVMYDAFFDGLEKKKTAGPSGSKEDVDNSEGDVEDSEDDMESDEDPDKDTERLDEQMDEDLSGKGIQEVTPLLGLKKTEEKSSFEKDRERELMVMSTLEEDNIGEKPWFLKGEAVSADRPENSTLEEQLDYNIVARQRPVITEDTTTLVEKIILNRIRSKAWDDVNRKVKPNKNPYEYKKKLLLNQEKNKRSLAEIYEFEYLKQQKKSKEVHPEKELPEHTEIREKMDTLFGLLDALSNYHFTPKMRSAEFKIQSNLPAISMEETTPVTASDATLLAPEEILASGKGELRGKSELTETDKKRARRSKKLIQKKKAESQSKNLKAKLKRSAAGGKKLDAKTSIKFVEKAVKAGQVKMLDGHQNKAVRSSNAFFKKLQEKTAGNSGNSKRQHKKNPTSQKKRRKMKQRNELSASKLLL